MQTQIWKKQQQSSSFNWLKNSFIFRLLVFYHFQLHSLFIWINLEIMKFSFYVFRSCFLLRKDEYNLNPGLEWDDEFAGRTSFLVN